MTLSNISELIKKFVWIAIAIILVISLSFLIFIRLSNTKKQPNLPLINKVKFELLNINAKELKTNKLTLPKDAPNTFPVFNISENDLFNNSTRLAKSLGFQNQASNLNDAELGQGLLYSNQQAALTIYKNGVVYQKYSKNLLPGGFSNSSNFKNIALQYLNNLALGTNFTQQTKIIFYKQLDEYLLKTENQTEASVIEFAFSNQLNNVPVVSTRKEISTQLDNQGSMLKFSYYSMGNAQEINQYPIIKPEIALQTLLQDNPSPIKISLPNDYTPLPLRFDQVLIDNIFLAYYLSDKAEQTQPVWVFEGTSQIADGEAILTYAVPAIDPQYFTNP